MKIKKPWTLVRNILAGMFISSFLFLTIYIFSEIWKKEPTAVMIILGGLLFLILLLISSTKAEGE